MKRYSASALRADLYKLLDRVLETGEPLEIERRGRVLRIVAERKTAKLDLLKPPTGLIIGDPMDLVHMDWSSEWKP